MCKNENRYSNEIAIIIPVYNAEKYLEKCIKSVLKQTFQSFHLVLVDDGSKDNSSEICDKYAKKDSRIFVIHQENSGSIEARKKGIFSEIAQKSKYIFISDADDMLEKKTLKILYERAEQNHADCVCGQTRRMWKGITFQSKFVSPCFKNKDDTIYTQSEIMNDLYSSCFGISNYPVSLYAKLYKTELITEAIDFLPIVKFMGEDLSVTLRCLPITKKLVITSEYIYRYRVGGGTSKFMPFMLDDFLSLYRLKRELILKYALKNARLYLDIEILNIIWSWFMMCCVDGKFADAEMIEEIKRVISLPEIREAAKYVHDYKRDNIYSEIVLENDYMKMMEMIKQKKIKSFLLKHLKNILYSM